MSDALRIYTFEVFYHSAGFYKTGVEIEAATLDEACELAIEQANSGVAGGEWRSSDWCGPTHVLEVYDQDGVEHAVPPKYSSPEVAYAAKLNTAAPRMLVMIRKLVNTYMPPVESGVDSRSVDDVLVEACGLLMELDPR